MVALDPKGQSVENVNFNAYSIGAAANELIQVNNTYQVSDTFTRVLGNHILKFGGNLHFDRINADAIAQFNGNYVFSGTETGVDFADFLIGIPSQFNQSQLNPFDARNKYVGLFAQDSWHAQPNLTVNYGLRWDRIAPWTEKYNQISTFVPGAQSQVFPGAPAGILYPTDPGIPDTIAPVDEKSFAPRIGVAWTPQAETGSFLGKILGTPGTAKRRFFYGPGADNYEMALAKSLALTGSKSMLFRVEVFNVFNHAPFNGPSSVDGNIGSSTFGNVVSAAPPRILQGAAKFMF
ncbi:MAG: TonB-dependent receptor domain-containing protein [Acidobacteriaceae bacterium]